MNKIIICISICTLVLLAGCGEDCTTHIENNDKLMALNNDMTGRYNNCLDEKDRCNNDLAKERVVSGQMKIQLLTPTTTTQTSCTTCTRMLNTCEQGLEDCWMYNQTQNETCKVQLNNCNEIIQLVNDTLN